MRLGGDFVRYLQKRMDDERLNLKGKGGIREVDMRRGAIAYAVCSEHTRIIEHQRKKGQL